MASWSVRAIRTIAAAPFLFIAVWCAREMDLQKIAANQQPFEESGVIEWDGGKISITEGFYKVDIFNKLFFGGTATFSPATFGYDAVSWWQLFAFLVDLGPVYTVWILESYRTGIAYTPMYFPTIFTFAGQMLGLGPVAPVFYCLYFIFGPTASGMAASPVRDRTVWRGNGGVLLLVVFLFHTAEVFAMFLAPDFEIRHYWTWAWQLTPIWIGVGNLFLSTIVAPFLPKTNMIAPPKILTAVLGLFSAGVWGYTLLFSPYSLSTLLIPAVGPQSEFITHCRKAFQADYIGVLGSSLLWLVYSFFDLGSVGLLGRNWFYYVALLPVVTALVGPGAAFILGWYLRERALSVKRNQST
ncbi:uncharacterized protein F4822DRAFT_108362 [Hypoxylon trugodes]|uniref:uncharacterized protein n=1 Tax=Hypoxylon trugodes TaxID=326681 RepID=UPI0021967D4F|nr:uncharacterized protein F4822DRAFT_108362 [Hypoxylon trugodes]KAI1391874.1 hypothetical protein F4822DRAFT_108362 [Hypoxylon trugodes]